MTKEISDRELEIIEALAAVEHERWSGWMRYLFSHCAQEFDRKIIPRWACERWTIQSCTPYSNLTEKEKESDRVEARKTIAALRACGVEI